MQRPIWFACDEHIDILIDEIVDKYSLAPDMEIVDNSTAESKVCSWCKQLAKYQLELEIQAKDEGGTP
jgi:CxxH/CxxC protein (TIGR04129 family)